MSMNPFVGWGLSTLALYFLNKGSKSGSDASSMEPSDLNVTQTKIGAVIPAVMGKALIKSPLTIYFGDFSSRPYTETYAAHANFNAWPLVFALIAQYIASPNTTVGSGGGPVTGGDGGYAKVEILGKDMAVGPLINTLFMWLLSWLINGRNLKTTIQKGFKYYLGYQQLICWSSPQIKLKKIYMNENLVWEGSVGRGDQMGAAFVIKIDNEDLFGGVDEQGGFVGEIHIYFGGETQLPDDWMAGQMRASAIPADLQGLTPAYRPFLSVVIPTTYIGKQATIPAMWYEVEDMPAHVCGGIGSDANPADVLYELHVNKDWGLAEDGAGINLPALRETGSTLFSENIGMTVPLTSKATAGQVIDSVCEHINAVKYIEPSNGLLTYKLIREENADMMLLNESNLSSISFTRLDWRETISIIEATYTDRAALYETGSLTDTDNANVEINHGIITTKSYPLPYFTSPEAALWAAKRELMQQGYPLASISVEGNRNLYLLRIGDLVCLNFPPYGIKDMVCRVTDVNQSDLVDGVIKLELLEDIFSLAKTNFGFSNSTEWKPAPLYPTGVQTFTYLELPYEIMQVQDTYVYAMAVQPDSVTQTWTMWRKSAGAAGFSATNTMSKWTAAARLVYDYDEFGDAEDLIGIEVIDLGGMDDLRYTALSGGGGTDIVSARRGGKVLMMGEELMAWSNIVQLPSGHWRIEGIMRGVYDTVPQPHGNGEILYFLQSGHWGNVVTGGSVCRAGNTASEFYNITTGTVSGQEAFDSGKVRKVETTQRTERPSPPGRVRMNAHLLYDVLHSDKVAGDLDIAFTPRNKQISYGCVGQDDRQDYWANTAFVLPMGLEYIVEVYNNANLLNTYTLPSTAVNFSYPWAQRVLDGGSLADIQGETTVKIYAKLNGLLSHQPQQRTFTWIIPTLIHGMDTENNAAACAAGWGDGVEFTVQANAASDVQRVKYAELPLILLGTPTAAAGTNTLIVYSGDYVVPDGRALLFKDANTYELVALPAGFTLRTKFHEPGTSAAYTYWQWSGTQFTQMV